MQPQVRYVRSADGTNIAFTAMGDSSGVPMIFVPNLWCHLEMQLDFREAWQRMAGEGIMLVPYDMRGMGMSDRDIADFSLDSQMSDIDAIRRHLNFERFALCGNIFGSIAAIAYAANHQESVSHLILNVPFAYGAEAYRSIPTLQGLETLRAMGEEHWEFYTLMHATAILPEGDAKNLAALMRACTTADTLRRYFNELQTQDVRPLLAEIRCPTLVLSANETQLPVVHPRFAREVAAGIPGARIAAHEAQHIAPGLPSARLTTEFVLGRPVDWPAATAASPLSAPSSGMTAILFMDIVDSTALTERLGDAAFREKARALGGSLRALIRECAGTPVEGPTLGDGVLAVFTSAREAIEAARRCGKAGDDAGLPLHLGLHAGDVSREKDPDGRDNVYGGAVNIASRISGLSAPGEVLVSETVRSLARTSAGVAFEDRGEQTLKGVGEVVRVWAVSE